MERLTERLESGAINVKYASQHETAIHRLVTIEDILGNEYDLDRLRELMQAEREGRCVVLPVKLGDKVCLWAARRPDTPQTAHERGRAKNPMRAKRSILITIFLPDSRERPAASTPFTRPFGGTCPCSLDG